ncbi:MAG: hypothetical protein HFH30_13930 [Eubacterium sp.]|nr:hypothetical protein [Eubacterium sp.]MCI8919369.1 hypothetical protein [Eubacterium sp.]
MGELKQMTDRIGFEGFMEYLMYGGETDCILVTDDGKDVYQKRIDAAFEELFDGLKQIFPSASRDNDALYSTVLDFSIAHQETYTAMGFLAGLRFCMDLRKACSSVGGDKIQSAIKKAVPEQGGVIAVEMGDGSQLEIRRREDA